MQIAQINNFTISYWKSQEGFLRKVRITERVRAHSLEEAMALRPGCEYSEVIQAMTYEPEYQLPIPPVVASYKSCIFEGLGSTAIRLANEMWCSVSGTDFKRAMPTSETLATEATRLRDKYALSLSDQQLSQVCVLVMLRCQFDLYE
jgi:hypothetical protein